MNFLTRVLKSLLPEKNNKPKLLSFWASNDIDTVKAILICHRGKKVIAKKINLQSVGKVCGKLWDQPIYDSIVYNHKNYYFDGAQPTIKLKKYIGMLHLKSLKNNTIIVEPGIRYLPYINEISCDNHSDYQ